jgi:hypothetical protein
MAGLPASALKSVMREIPARWHVTSMVSFRRKRASLKRSPSAVRIRF